MRLNAIGRGALVAAALTALSLAALLAACGGDDDDATPEATATASGTATADATSTPGSSDGGGGVAEDGDTVRVHYTGTLDSGEEFDSSRGRDPLEFTIGAQDVISGFENAVRGLAVGESVTVRLEPADAYGERDESLVVEIPADQAPEGLEVGQQVQFTNGAVATVTEIGDDTITVDQNHPLAGQVLTFEIELVEIL